MDFDGRATSRMTAGLPQTLHSGLTPLGEIEQATKIAAGLKVPRHGWRKAVVTIGVGLLALAAAAILVGLLLADAQH
ncbi:hypothetical protein ACWT_4550 [Actinoplanes sp. SE50]|uniref:hypothetical protein n=1 Tax=unclassified Actinoplanes TaxID=2626549 RepID=UPI00023ED274|nr:MULTISPECIES: hypothetical protein [unclassified Actinoplanes]AEV85572.1 hypothetical protein ACPL_4681 [Actinoplanes sp. SE50/110]ATO83965.1 hypothetical protein ACWT_4550 [Actinoplanes sp. SE50]SLM01375.1 hypothetical protein ACSP50_4611 [Actinoplanes sp. SE50/110]